MNKLNKRKGILLAGGKGTRLFPCTLPVSKHILPVFDKPMIFYPLSLIMLSGIRELVLITTPRDLKIFRDLLGDGSQWGLEIEYITQNKPEGIAQSLVLAEDYLDGCPSLLVLGDNIFYGDKLSEKLREANELEEGALIFSHFVQDPERYGVIEFYNDGRIKDIEEKPKNPKSNTVVTGIYFFDKYAPKYAKKISLSKRNEFEIIDLIKIYLEKEKLFNKRLGRGYAWLDTGTHESLLNAQLFIQTIEKRQGLKIGCLEELAYNKKWITKSQLIERANIIGENEYGNYLRNLN